MSILGILDKIEKRDPNKCIRCGSTDPKVEAGGIWYCPNPRCHAPGGGGVRHLTTCPNCRIKDDGRTFEVLATCEVYRRDHAEEVPRDQK